MVKYNLQIVFFWKNSYMHKHYMLYRFFWIYMKSSKNVIVCNWLTDIKWFRKLSLNNNFRRGWHCPVPFTWHWIFMSKSTMKNIVFVQTLFLINRFYQLLIWQFIGEESFTGLFLVELVHLIYLFWGSFLMIDLKSHKDQPCLW